MFWILFFRKFDKMCISVSVLRYALTGHTVVVVGGQVNFFRHKPKFRCMDFRKSVKFAS